MNACFVGEIVDGDLPLIYPKAVVHANCITTEQYEVLVKRFLFESTASGNGTAGVPDPEAC